jgi:WD40 repeat protein
VSTKREVAVLKGHTGSVHSVAFDGSGKYLASGCGDSTVRLWDVSTKREVAVLKGHTGSVHSVAFDGSGKYLASGSGTREFHPSCEADDYIDGEVLTQESKKWSYDFTVRLWDVSA